jgi:hypothetical protein
MTNEAEAAAGPVVEKFAASGGRWLGIATVAFCLAMALVLALDDPAGSVKGFYVLAAIVLVSWVALIRPAASIRANGVLLRNMVHDSFVPSAKIVRCAVLQTLQVATDEKHYHCVGVSKSARGMMREKTGRRYGGLMLPSRLESPEPVQRRYGEAVIGGSYSDYVASRIRSLADDASDDGLQPVVAVVWPAVAALVIAGVLVVLLFV